MRALITGAGGFCGGHLKNYLQQTGVDVYTLGTSYREGKHELVDDLSLDALIPPLSKVHPDFIFHLAGVAVAHEPSIYYSVNCGFAASILDALETAGLSECRVLIVGTAAEYGVVTADQLPIREGNPALPYSHYGISKLAQTLMSLAPTVRNRVVVVRPFNILGAGMGSHLALRAFADQIAEIKNGQRDPVIETGNLESTRDFLDVNEVVRVYWDLIRCSDAYGQIVNVCSGSGVSIRHLLNNLIQLSGLDVEVRTDPGRLKAVDIAEHFGSNDKLNELIGYRPNSNLDRSLTAILQHSYETLG